jgi:two-component system, sensor histidine kinase and response regulator
MKKAIICIDDEKIVLDSLKNEFRSFLNHEYLFETSESGNDALLLIDELIEEGYDIAIVIADYIMPGMKGDEVLISVHRKLPDAKTILLTGQATMEGVTHAVNDAGLYRYIAKPWEQEDLVLTIKEALRIHETEKQLEERRKELEIANKKLIVLDRSKTYFIMLLAHELKTPIQTISGFNEILKRSIEDTELMEFCDNIEASAERLKKFTDFSLLILELLNDKYPFFLQEHNLKQLLDTVLFDFKFLSDKKNIRIEKRLYSEKMDLIYDENLIKKVIEIVLDNAIKYSSNNSDILITDSFQENIYTLSIIDNGIGFSAETLENLFKFFVSDDIMHHSVGYGLGLATAKLIMDAHKYSIVIANRDVGAIVNLIFTK